MQIASLLSNSREQNHSWKADSSSASQKIPKILLNSRFHNRIQKTLSPVPILSQIDPINTPIQTLEDPF